MFFFLLNLLLPTLLISIFQPAAFKTIFDLIDDKKINFKTFFSYFNFKLSRKMFFLNLYIFIVSMFWNILLIIPGIYWSLKVSLAPLLLLVNQDTKILKIISTSKLITKGYKLIILEAILCLMFLYILINLVIFLPFILVQMFIPKVIFMIITPLVIVLVMCGIIVPAFFIFLGIVFKESYLKYQESLNNNIKNN